MVHKVLLSMESKLPILRMWHGYNRARMVMHKQHLSIRHDVMLLVLNLLQMLDNLFILGPRPFVMTIDLAMYIKPVILIMLRMPLKYKHTPLQLNVRFFPILMRMQTRLPYP